jgi:hypothetical protein
VFENRVLRKIFGPKREKVTGGWRRLHNEELHNLHASPNFGAIESRGMRWAGRVTRVWEMISARNILVAKAEGKRPFGRPRGRWEYNIRM